MTEHDFHSLVQVRQPLQVSESSALPAALRDGSRLGRATRPLTRFSRRLFRRHYYLQADVEAQGELEKGVWPDGSAIAVRFRLANGENDSLASFESQWSSSPNCRKHHREPEGIKSLNFIGAIVSTLDFESLSHEGMRVGSQAG